MSENDLWLLHAEISETSTKPCEFQEEYERWLVEAESEEPK